MFRNGKYIKHPQRRVTKSGNVILRGKAYDALKLEKWIGQGHRCADCHGDLDFAFAELHHKKGRGMNGGKRSDTREATKLLCHSCHGKYEAGVRRVA